MREATEKHKTIKDEGRGSEVLMKLETSKGGIKQGKWAGETRGNIRKWDVWNESTAVVSNEKVDVITPWAVSMVGGWINIKNWP